MPELRVGGGGLMGAQMVALRDRLLASLDSEHARALLLLGVMAAEVEHLRELVAATKAEMAVELRELHRRIAALEAGR